MSYQKSRDNSVYSEKRVSQWEELMRKFSEAHREECKSMSVDIPRVMRSVKHFPTGSQYSGTWDVLGMSGVGVYTFPNGVIYEGEFNDGMFHGNGDLKYPSGVVLKGKWRKGQMIERKLVFADGLEYSEVDWKYCKMPDRRFSIEYKNGLQPAGRSYMSADQPTREIPEGYYDTGDGFYDPKTKAVYKADDITTIIRSPSRREQIWIVKNCRNHCQKEVGPRRDLYEEWLRPVIDPEPAPVPTVQSNATILYSQNISFDDDAETVRLPYYEYRPAEDTLSTQYFQRQPEKEEQNIIEANYRSPLNIPLGPQPDFYEKWCEPTFHPKKPPTSSLMSIQLGSLRSNSLRLIQQQPSTPLHFTIQEE